MKAVELNIVFEDDEGKTYVKRYVGEDAEDRVTVCGHKGENPCVRIDSPYEVLSIGEDLHGPVLRKVTEYTGHLHAHFTNTMMPPGADEPDENGVVGSLDENVDKGDHAQTGVLDDSAELAIDRRALPFRLLRYDERPHEPGDDKIVGMYAGPDYRVRVDVTAVRVEEKEGGR